MTDVVLIDDDMLRRSERWIKSCEVCTPAEAQIPFDWILDRVTGCDPSVTNYVLARPARCLRCGGGVMGKTVVVFREDGFGGERELPGAPKVGVRV